ncbi:MAG: riboflavin synthase [Acidimicrobiales bacterium]
MFTGIVEELGRFDGRQDGRLRFRAGISSVLAVGGSVAVNGCCLTVVELGEGWWVSDVVDETLSRTTLGSLRPGDPVNLERPLTLATPLGGHLVQGHVDGVGDVRRAAPELEVGMPAPLACFVAEKGSITVDGVSLTVASAGEGAFGVAVIPHTAAVTTLGRRRAGDGVNLEVDLLARYVHRLLAPLGGVALGGVAPGGALGGVTLGGVTVGGVTRS